MRVTSATGNCRRCRGKAPARGFTLIELLVVMTILVMTAAVLPLALDHVIPARRVEALSHRLVALIRDAQSESVMVGRAIDLRVAPGGRSIQAGARSLPVPTNVALALTSPDGQSLSALRVYPDGSAQGGQFHLSDGHSHDALVVVSGITGRVWREGRR